jgi:hypothetical protein
LRLKSFWRKLCNYVKTLLFLFIALTAWVFLGFTASHAFPLWLSDSLINYLFSGFKVHKWKLEKAVDHSLNCVWQGVKLQLGNIPPSKSVNATGCKGEAKELNRLDSGYWLLIAAIKLLTTGINPSDKSSIDWKLSELDEQRDFILERLQPLKRKHYRWLSQVQNFWNSCYEVFTLKAVRRERELKQIEKVFNDLVRLYLQQEPTSREVLQEMLEVLDEKVTSNPRIKTLYKAGRLINWVYSYIEKSTPVITEDPIYEKLPVRAIRRSPCYHLPNGCRLYPRVEKSKDSERIKFFETVEEAKAENLYLCGKCKIILRNK